MLVLSRQRDETIMIGDDIEITVVDIRGDKIRLGIDAPSDVAVHRKEVYEAIRRENEQAARLDAGQIDQLRLTTSPNRNQQNRSKEDVNPSPKAVSRKRRTKGLRAVTSVHGRKADPKQVKSA